MNGNGVRWVAVVGLVVATVIHVMVATSSGGGLLAVLFWLSAVGTLVGAGLLLWRPNWAGSSAAGSPA